MTSKFMMNSFCVLFKEYEDKEIFLSALQNSKLRFISVYLIQGVELYLLLKRGTFSIPEKIC